jgi:hypothetical protein
MPGRCRSRRRFVIHLRKPPKGDRIRSATVTINGKRQRSCAAGACGRSSTSARPAEGQPSGGHQRADGDGPHAAQRADVPDVRRREAALSAA